MRKIAPYFALLSRGLLIRNQDPQAKAGDAKVIVDTSGPALEPVVQKGVYLIKPNIGEQSRMPGVDEVR